MWIGYPTCTVEVAIFRVRTGGIAQLPEYSILPMVH
jgi:hypothetical protein